MTEGILSFQSSTAPSSTKASKDANGDVDRPDAEKGQELRKARLARRGACQAFEQLSAKFGDRLLEVIPNMWPSMAGGLLSAFKSSTHVLFFIWVYAHSCLDSSQAPDTLIEKQFGQDVIDSLSVLEAVVPTFHEGLRPMLQDLFPMMELALLSRFAIVRQAAARCFAIICDVMTPEAMRYVVEKVIPFLQDPLVLTNRQGTIELIYRLFFTADFNTLANLFLIADIVNRLDIKALPYVIFMVVPVLGRMSDPNDEVRSTATNTFASLVKMVPLEVGLVFYPRPLSD